MKFALSAAVFLLGSTASFAATLTFDGDICENGDACSDGLEIDQSYGDEAGVDFVYDADTSTTENENMLFWTDNYSDLTNVAYGIQGAQASISLIAQAGYTVTLEAFDLGAWSNQDRDTSLTVIDLATGTNIFQDLDFTVDGDTAFFASIEGNPSNVGYQLLFGPDAYNVGIDNINFSTALIGEEPEPVPLPASALLLLGGLGGLGAMRRRRKA